VHNCIVNNNYESYFVNKFQSLKMQETIVISIAIAAFAYLLIKFIAKDKSHNCDKCDLSENEPKKH